MTRMLVRGYWVDVIFAAVFGITVPYAFLVVGRDLTSGIISMYNRHSSSIASTRVPNASPPVTPAASSPSADPDPYGLDVDPDVDDDAEPQMKPSDLATSNVDPAESPTIDLLIRRGAVSLPACAVCIVGVAVASATDKRHQKTWASAAFAPLGASLRWYLSRFNKDERFPLGTFIANVAASTLDVCLGALLVQRPLSLEANVVITALIKGFAGSLSTLSTFLNEADKMPTRRRYFYILSSVGVVQLVGLVIYGGSYWASRGR